MTDQKGVTRKKGTPYHFNLDGHSLGCLNACREICKANGAAPTNSVIVRRAVRFYSEHLGRLKSSPRYHTEGIELQRAAKGVV